MKNVARSLVCISWLAACSPPPVTPADSAPDSATDSAIAEDSGAEGGADSATDSGDASAPGCTVAPSTDPAIVATDRGRVRGTVDGDVRMFRGVPYAAPPVGSLRFRAPIEHACWSEDRDATQFGAVCPQLDDSGAPTGDEDCLTLNVFAPATAPASPLPVLFFIHGGGNNQGSAQVAAALTQGRGLYDGRSLARRGAVVVTIQYRLGALGFLSHDALDRESPSEPSGTQGLRDQILALRWVQRNIRAFGGDPARVMVFGESAGGLDTMLLVSSPRAAGLFSRALSQSGGIAAPTQAVARAAGLRLVMGASCASESDTLACLRSKTAAQLLMALPATVSGLVSNDFNPSIDGDVLPESPIERVRAGRHNQVPVVYGTNSEETSRMVPPAAMVQTAADFERIGRAYLSQYGLTAAQTDMMLAAYAPAMFDSPHAALVGLTTDTRWTCPARSTLRALDGAQDAPVFRYFFTHRLDARIAPMSNASGASHGLELGFVFGTIDGLGGYRVTAADTTVINAMQRAWISFAATGELTTADPAWPAYSASDPYLEIASPPVQGMGVRTDRCDTLARIVAGG